MKVEYFEVWTHANELVAACKYIQDAEIFATLVHPGSRVVPMVSEPFSPVDMKTSSKPESEIPNG